MFFPDRKMFYIVSEKLSKMGHIFQLFIFSYDPYIFSGCLITIIPAFI